ncbi:MAG: phosphoenolpyruvate--protein phosphotransferase [Planctomycetota bacterium]
MEIKKGIGVSPGVVMGKAFVLESDEQPIMRRFFARDELEQELSRFEQAVERAHQEVQLRADQVRETIGEEYSGIFQAHLRMLEDKKLLLEVRQLITEKNFTAEYAVSRIIRKYMKRFSKIEDAYLADRVRDLTDIENRLLRALRGEEHRMHYRSRREPMILVARDLTTDETAMLDRKKVLAFATDAGGRTSHTAIVARALGIPAVVGLETVTGDVAMGDTVILDGTHGIVIVNPDEATVHKYEGLRDNFLQLEADLKKFQTLPAVTLDNCEVRILANIEFPQEVELGVRNGAEGIGLYRTEFLYLNRATEPSEEDHFEAYLQAIKHLGGRRLTIRTVDLGADKFFRESRSQKERNPFLGLRSIRLSFQHVDQFKVQLRAILRASAFGDIQILLPMISSVSEVRRAKGILEEVKDELRQKGASFKEDIKVGIMVEVPSVAVAADFFTAECDFFSIGTNDLIQYTLAVDRVNERVASLFNPTDPAVLRLVQAVIEAGKRGNIPVAMCGEMSGDPLFTILLLGMGLREFSVAPGVILEIKKLIRSVTLAEAGEAARQTLEFKTAAEISNYLKEKAERILPGVF